MPEILRSALMPFAAEYMYQIVNDVAAYPQFLPWCGGGKKGCWRFTPIAGDASKIELALSFDMDKSLTAMLIKPAFTRIANTMVESFCNRAQALNEQ